jgi:hypothetical protein
MNWDWQYHADTERALVCNGYTVTKVQITPEKRRFVLWHGEQVLKAYDKAGDAKQGAVDHHARQPCWRNAG